MSDSKSVSCLSSIFCFIISGRITTSLCSWRLRRTTGYRKRSRKGLWTTWEPGLTGSTYIMLQSFWPRYWHLELSSRAHSVHVFFFTASLWINSILLTTRTTTNPNPNPFSQVSLHAAVYLSLCLLHGVRPTQKTGQYYCLLSQNGQQKHWCLYILGVFRLFLFLKVPKTSVGGFFLVLLSLLVYSLSTSKPSWKQK